MGHTHLVRLPATRKWRDVLELLAGGAPAEEVLSASASAIERDLANAAQDPVFIEAVRLLCQIPKSAQAENFAASMRHEGMDAGSDPTLLDIAMAASQRLDAVRGQARSANDFSELSARALVSTLSEAFGSAILGLLEASTENLKIEVKKFASPEGFERLSRMFFGKLLDGTLRYWLDRTMPAQTGDERRFRTMSDRTNFDGVLTQYVAESTRIIKEFSRGWYAKAAAPEGSVSSSKAAAFGYVAFKKIGEELRRKRGGDD